MLSHGPDLVRIDPWRESPGSDGRLRADRYDPGAARPAANGPGVRLAGGGCDRAVPAAAAPGMRRPPSVRLRES